MQSDFNQSLNREIKYDLTPEVCEIDSMNFSSCNVIPHEWYQNIRLESGMVDLISITLLADFVYWYRPTYVRDESTGRVIEVRKKFRSDLLQKSKANIAEQFGFTERQVRDSLKRLDDLGLIKREYRTLKDPIGKFLVSNVLFIQIFPERIFQISQPPGQTPMTLKRHTPPAITPDNTYTIPKTSLSESPTEKVVIETIENQEQTPAAGNNNSSAKVEKKPEKKKDTSKIYKCLKDLNIYAHTKKAITRHRTKEEAERASLLLIHEDSPYLGKTTHDGSLLIQHILKYPESYDKTIDSLGQPKQNKATREAKQAEIEASETKDRIQDNKNLVCMYQHGKDYNGWKCSFSESAISFTRKSPNATLQIAFRSKTFLKELEDALKKMQF